MTRIDPSDGHEVTVKAMDLLKFSDRTESELRLKLKQKGYEPEAIDQAVAYVYKYHYLDDLRYAEGFIRNRMSSVSRLVLKQKLLRKGVSSEDIETAFSNVDSESGPLSASEGNGAPGSDDPELGACVSCLRKKLNGSVADSPEAGKKLLAYLLRKGFRYETVKASFMLIEQELSCEDSDI